MGRPVRYSLDQLLKAFQRQTVLTLPSMMQALGTPGRMTVFRKLAQLDYRASYSHAGQYYTLVELARWDEEGLWAFHGIRFSYHGSLLETLQAFIDTGPSGWRAEELEDRLGVRVHNALSTLYRRGGVVRQQVGSSFVYVSTAAGDRQLRRRRRAEEERVRQQATGFQAPQVAETLPVFLATLNEKQRRLYAGFESVKWGAGGDAAIAAITGLNIKTVARGRRELLSRNFLPDRIRAAGGGRPAVEKKTPTS
jgi:hypothetical protein